MTTNSIDKVKKRYFKQLLSNFTPLLHYKCKSVLERLRYGVVESIMGAFQKPLNFKTKVIFSLVGIKDL